MISFIKKFFILWMNYKNMCSNSLPSKKVVEIYLKRSKNRGYQGNITSVANTYVNYKKCKTTNDIQSIHTGLTRYRIEQILLKIGKEVTNDIKSGRYKV